MPNPIGPLIAEDERFTHQVADTFATVGTTDPSWTEKVCAMAMARDGSLQIGFGLGKYTNRNVMDSYAALSRGKEQLTVRVSRALSSDPEQQLSKITSNSLRKNGSYMNILHYCKYDTCGKNRIFICIILDGVKKR